MRCPKCHYLSFEPEPRCKNCGYDLSFSPGDLLDSAREDAEDETPEMPLHSREPEPTPAAVTPVAPPRGRPAVSPIAPELTAAPARPPVPVSAPPATTELPLFVQTLSNSEPELVEDRPLVKLPPAPRPPLAVRRQTPAPGRVREKYHRQVEAPRQPELLQERDVLDSVELHPSASARRDELEPPSTPEVARVHEESASAPRRIEAAVVDLLFLGSINLVVVWLTLQQCQLTVGEIGLLPILPVAAFLFVLDGGYLLMFTATNGQTVGKMAAGIRVVSEADDATSPQVDRVTFRQAVLRAALTFPSVLALGLGFLPALLGDGLALHDRFTHTRVVRA